MQVIPEDQTQEENSSSIREMNKFRSHTIYEEIGKNIGQIVDEKNRAYGDSFNQSVTFLKLLYPDGIKPDQYRDLLGLIRVWDKQKRIATAKDALGESPWNDIAGYGILMSK